MPRYVPGLFLFVHKTTGCLQEAELRFKHVTCTVLLHKGIWNPKQSCLLKPHHPPSALKKPRLSPAKPLLGCPVHRQTSIKDRNTAHSAQGCCCKVQACLQGDFDQKRKKKAQRIYGNFILFQTLLIFSLVIPERSGMTTALYSS